MAFIVRWPDHVDADRDTGALFVQVDLAAWLAALAGAEIPAGACQDTSDELDALLGKDETGRPHLVHEGRGPQALRTAHWKFIAPGPTRDSLNPGPTTPIDTNGALYNLQSDRDESTNLIDDYPEQAAAMRKKLRAIATAPDRE